MGEMGEMVEMDGEMEMGGGNIMRGRFDSIDSIDGGSVAISTMQG
jgi:hypothetical protein